MGFTKKTWKNRIAEYINRRQLTMEDGSTSLVTVARDEGTISQEGDAFNAANMNDLEDRIAAGFEEINQSLTQLGNCDLIQLKDLGTSTTETTLNDKLSNYEYIIIFAYNDYNIYDFSIIPYKFLINFPLSIVNVKDNSIKILSDIKVGFIKGSTLSSKIFGYKKLK